MKNNNRNEEIMNEIVASKKGPAIRMITPANILRGKTLLVPTILEKVL